VLVLLVLFAGSPDDADEAEEGAAPLLDEEVLDLSKDVVGLDSLSMRVLRLTGCYSRE
jgi:hypothetical protein